MRPRDSMKRHGPFVTMVFCSGLVSALSVMCADSSLLSGPDQPCTPEQVVSCTCDSGPAGTQVCQSDGTFGLCNCDDDNRFDVDPLNPDTGGDDETVGLDAPVDADPPDTSASETGPPDSPIEEPTVDLSDMGTVEVEEEPLPEDVLAEIDEPPADQGLEVTDIIEDASLTEDLTSCACDNAELPCCDGCDFLPSNEVCDENAGVEYGCPWGTACGDNVGARDLERHCSGTSSGCDGAVLPSDSWEQNDTCTAWEVCSIGETTCQEDRATCCPATEYWDPTSDDRLDTSDGITLRAELEAVGDQVRIRICKTEGTFLYDLDVYFEDWVKTTGRTVFDGTLVASGTCTAWGWLDDTHLWDEGDGLGGQIRVVSPNTCASEWGRWCNPEPDVGCGYCWKFDTGIMTRTCREP